MLRKDRDAVTTPEQLDILRSYAAGKAGTRTTIERAGFRDYADLVIALVQNDLDFPRPPSTPTHDANLARAPAILLPRLRRGN